MIFFVFKTLKAFEHRLNLFPLVFARDYVLTICRGWHAWLPSACYGEAARAWISVSRVKGWYPIDWFTHGLRTLYLWEPFGQYMFDTPVNPLFISVILTCNLCKEDILYCLTKLRMSPTDSVYVIKRMPCGVPFKIRSSKAASEQIWQRATSDLVSASESILNCW